MLKQITIVAIALAVTTFEVEAKRVGGSRSSGAQRPATVKQVPKEQNNHKDEDAKASFSIRAPRMQVSSPATAMPSHAPAADPDAVRRQSEQMLLRAAEEDEKRRELEEKRAEAIAAYEKEQAEERRRLARAAQEREAHRLKLVRESRCQFKPVMTDDDIARCREVYR
jgi:hypothetical protein